ncbi:MAG TPA: hypothetical protein PLT04_02315 [Candidatus Saccharibacteria bacterium]|nr:hypothetical protein [Candidatus Saccharibacteria bacterium]
MSETLPSQQNETQAWERELPLHREVAGTLKPEETLALIGSFTQSSLEAEKEANEAGEISDYEFSMKQTTHAAALEQLSTLQLGEGDTVNDVIYSRKKELEAALGDIESDSRRHAEALKLREQIAGVKLLDSMYLNVVDNVDSLATATGDGNKRNPRNRAVAINQLIEQHNKQVSPEFETIADSPEMREAQERINARYAEQTKQSRPTETVDDARQKVAEAFGNTGEKEQQALIGEVAQAAKGATRIYTDIPKDIMLKSNSGDFRPIDGFNSFGDGLPQESRNVREKLEYGGSAEAFLFEPDTTTRYKTVTKTIETGGRFKKKTEQVQEQVPDGEVPTMVMNLVTGQQEPGVKVAYQFNGNNRRDGAQTAYYEGPEYTTESGRGGNQLWIEATLPKSVADRLKQEVTSNPEVAHEFAKTLALNNGITEQAWNNGVQPPFDKVPSDWTMAVVDLQKDTQYGDVRHNVVSRQAVKTR